MRFTVFSIALVLSAQAEAQDGADSLSGLKRCVAIQTDTERLTCLDREAAALLTAASRKEITVVSRDEMRRSRGALFGFALPKIKLFGGEDTDAAPDEIQVTLENVRPLNAGLFRFTTTDNGAWETTEASSPLNNGDKARIKRGAMNGYILAPKNGRVRRVRRVM